MTVSTLLKGLKLGDAVISIRKRDPRYGLTFLGCGVPYRVLSRFGAYIVTDSTIADGVLVLYVE